MRFLFYEDPEPSLQLQKLEKKDEEKEGKDEERKMKDSFQNLKTSYRLEHIAGCRND